MKTESGAISFGQSPVHEWLKTINISFVPGPEITPLAERVTGSMLDEFRQLGHTVQEKPDDQTDIILTTAPFGKPLSWRKSLLMTGRMKYGYSHTPLVITMVNITRAEMSETISQIGELLKDNPTGNSEVEFPGLAPNAYKVLYEQGNRGGPILALERLVQAQAKCIRVQLLVGDSEPEELYHFDLVGSHPASLASSPDFYRDIALRMVTTVSTIEITQHNVNGNPIPEDIWAMLDTPNAMRVAAREFGSRNFFTDMIRIQDLVEVPILPDAISNQYSEGCFATWDPQVNGMITTVTGSARPIDKSDLQDDDLAVIVGVRPDRKGAEARQVEGKKNDPPSSEAVELFEIDQTLPKIELGDNWGIENQVPVSRSKLHGHRGIKEYNPEKVEFVPLDPPYYHYPVSCATDAQATAIQNAFSRSEALNNPDDPRQVVFTILPTHGVVIVEKWVAGKQPFQEIWEYFDSNDLVIDNNIPQYMHRYQPSSGRMVLQNGRI